MPTCEKRRARGRTRLAWIALLSSLALGVSPTRAEEEPLEPVDVLIVGGHALIGRELELANVGVRGDEIVYVGTGRPAADRMISAAGRIVSPGFIDVNTVGLVHPTGEFLKLRDGTTTYLSAHGNPLSAILSPGCLNRAFVIRLDFGDTEGDTDFIGNANTALDRGFYGVSVSPEYRPDEVSPARIARLCQALATRQAVITFHARFSSRGRELEGVDEAIRCAERGARVHILHLNSTGGTFAPREAVRRLDAARAAGHSIGFDFYPFTYWKSGISWTRFDADWRARYEVSFAQVEWASDPTRTLDEESFAELQRTQPDSFVYVDSIPRATVDYLALETNAPIGSDTSPRSSSSHPRGAASFATFFRDYVKTERLPVAAALHRFSTATAERFADVLPGLADRGRIEVGAKADLIVLDVDAFTPHATRTDPLRASTGVSTALVGGAPLLIDGAPNELACRRAGRLLRGQPAQRVPDVVEAQRPSPATASGDDRER